MADKSKPTSHAVRCPQCGQPSVVYYTRRRPGNRVQRRRVCTNAQCRHAFDTYESVAPPRPKALLAGA